jgi:hypothetical protein
MGARRGRRVWGRVAYGTASHGALDRSREIHFWTHGVDEPKIGRLRRGQGGVGGKGEGEKQEIWRDLKIGRAWRET